MLFDGDPIGVFATKLVGPREADVLRAETGEADDSGPWSRWFAAAMTDSTIMYFSVEHEGEVVGEIFLHDIDRARREALVGYRIFRADQRHRGIGSTALRLLVGWATETGGFDTLFALARSDNVASRRIAERAAFLYMGPAREGHDRVVYRRSLPE
jgi:RimJ/RimL family protein N-acetyltransferase